MREGDTRGWVVVTSIHAPTASMERLFAQLAGAWNVVVVGDAKTPASWNDRPVEFLSLAAQHDLYGAFAAAAPLNHYSRKNFGYLYALQRGATCILDVDDDGAPHASFACDLRRQLRGRLVGGGDWANVYHWFTDHLIWPRGLPLDAIHRRGDLIEADAARDCPIQQFLVDNDPDVDAIYRQIFSATGFSFAPHRSAVLLDAGTWCPFNSQNTLWFPEVFPLLYLPAFCSVRVTDIWRSLVAQRALWLFDKSLAFHTSTLSQTRNPHDLNQDFIEEIPAYTRNRALAQCLERTAAGLAGHSVAAAGRRLWRALIDAGFLPEQEAMLIDRWFDACVAR